jgi:hypothetical protein
MSPPLTRAILALGLVSLPAMILSADHQRTPDAKQPPKVAVELVGRVHADNRGDPMGLAVVGSWAYLTAADDGLFVVDVSNPAAPKRVGSCRMLGSAKDITVAGHYAYVAARQGGLRVLDLSNPKAPAEVGSYQPKRAVREGAVEAGPLVEAVAVAGNYLCIASTYVPKDKDHRRGVVHVLDVSDPKAPTELGFWETSGQFVAMTVAGRHAYAIDKGSTLHVVDISDPKAPTAVSTCGALGEPHGVCVAGKHAYVSDDDGAMHIVDVSDPKAPKLVGSYEDGGDRPGIAEAVAVAGRYAYVCDDVGRAVRVVDVSDPKVPKEVASFDTAWPPRGVTVVGEYVYVNVWRGGLLVLKLTGQPAR